MALDPRFTLNHRVAQLQNNVHTHFLNSFLVFRCGDDDY
jgi:hypothetical protein